MSGAAMHVAVPHGVSFGPDEIDRWASEAPTARPFDAETVECMVEIGRALRRAEVAHHHPEVQALAFWLREAPLRELERAVTSAFGDELVASPRGTVFHVPPGNVDTVFVYSWVLAALAGNRNVVRLPTGSDDVVDGICAVIAAVLERPEFLGVRNRTRLVRYGHDRSVNEALSRACDVRVLWGGDESVLGLRAVPLPVHATELTFPDRFAYCLLDTDAVAGLDGLGLRALADRFVADAFWFDQLACSSPRLVVWRGREGLDAAQRSFFGAVSEAVVRVGYEAPLSAVLGKFTHAANAAVDESIGELERFSNEVFAVRLDSLGDFRREAPGGGFFYWVAIDELDELSDFVARRDQTVTHFGFAGPTLRAFAELVNGRGIDRLVPVGKALALNRYWDGFDLFAEFLRLTHVEMGR